MAEQCQLLYQKYSLQLCKPGAAQTIRRPSFRAKCIYCHSFACRCHSRRGSDTSKLGAHTACTWASGCCGSAVSCRVESPLFTAMAMQSAASAEAMSVTVPLLLAQNYPRLPLLLAQNCPQNYTVAPRLPAFHTCLQSAAWTTAQTSVSAAAYAAAQTAAQGSAQAEAEAAAQAAQAATQVHIQHACDAGAVANRQAVIVEVTAAGAEATTQAAGQTTTKTEAYAPAQAAAQLAACKTAHDAEHVLLHRQKHSLLPRCTHSVVLCQSKRRQSGCGTRHKQMLKQLFKLLLSSSSSCNPSSSR